MSWSASRSVSRAPACSAGTTAGEPPLSNNASPSTCVFSRNCRDCRTMLAEKPPSTTISRRAVTARVVSSIPGSTSAVGKRVLSPIPSSTESRAASTASQPATNEISEPFASSPGGAAASAGAAAPASTSAVRRGRQLATSDSKSDVNRVRPMASSLLRKVS